MAVAPAGAHVCAGVFRCVAGQDPRRVRNKAVYLAIRGGSGHRELLGMWIEREEGAEFWSRILNDLRVRGIQDILIVIVDGLKRFPEAIESQFPQTVIQTCIVHLLRHPMRFVSWKERKAVAAAHSRKSPPMKCW